MTTQNPQFSEQEFEALVLRRLRGELADDDARRLEILLAEPRWARRASRLERVWHQLELPPLEVQLVAPILLARLRGDELRWSLAPTWARAAAAVALVVGLAGGWSLGVGPDRPLDEAQVAASRPPATEPAKAPPATAPSVAEPPVAAPPVTAPPAAAPVRNEPRPPATATAEDGAADLFGGEASFGEAGFAESLWLAAEKGTGEAGGATDAGASP